MDGPRTSSADLSPRRRLLFRIVTLLVGLGVGIGIGEVAIRTLDLGPLSRVPRPMCIDRDLVIHQVDPDPRIGYSLRPGASGRFQGQETRINSLGCRGPELAGRRAGDPLVVSLGDSIAFGAGVRAEEAYAARLGELLRSEHPGLQVLNCGVSGYNLEQAMRSYDRSLAALAPDLVVLSLFADDIFPPYRIADRSPRSWLRERSALFRALELSPLWLDSAGNREVPPSVSDPADYEELVRRELVGWLARGRAAGTRFVAIQHPFLHRSEQVVGGPLQRLTELVASEGVEVLKMRPRYRLATNGRLLDLSIGPSNNDPHPNPRGHELIAGELVSVIRHDDLLRRAPGLSPGTAATEQRELVPVCVVLSSHRSGRDMGRGLELARRHLEEEATLRNRRIRWVIEEAEPSPEGVVNATNTVRASGCPLVIGPTRVEDVEHVLRATERGEVCLLLPEPGPTSRSEWDPYVVAISPPSSEMAAVAARDIFEKRGASHATVLYEATGFGEMVLRGWSDPEVDVGGTRTAVALDPNDGDAWRAAAERAVQGGAEALFIIGRPDVAEVVVDGLGGPGREAVHVWLIDGAVQTTTMASAERSGARDRIHLLGRVPPSAGFAQTYRAAFGATPPLAAATTYEAAMRAAMSIDSTPFLWHTDVAEELLRADARPLAFGSGRIHADGGLPFVEAASYQVIEPDQAPQPGARLLDPAASGPGDVPLSEVRLPRLDAREGQFVGSAAPPHLLHPAIAVIPPGAACPADMVHLDASTVHLVQGKLEPSPARVHVAPFCIDRFEYPNIEGVLPRAMVSWREADELCRAAGKRLCTSAEWDRACSGTEGRRYSYGDEFERDTCNTPLDSDGIEVTVPPYAASGSLPDCQSPEGVFDLNGNVSEWVSDPWEETRSGPILAPSDVQPPGAGSSSSRAVRGDTMWSRTSYDPSCFAEHGEHPGARTRSDGFRCCLTPP